MQQRQPRLGDILDDYCPRERRLTNHAVVAMIGDQVKQTRCTTCEAEHEYKHARVPRQRRKTEQSELYSQVLAHVTPKKVTPHDSDPSDTEDAPVFNAPESELPGSADSVESTGPADYALAVDEPAVSAADESEADASEDEGGDSEEPVEEGPAHRRLIRAQLPRHEGQVPVARQGPDFTIRQPNNPRANRFRPRHQRGAPGAPQFAGNRGGAPGNGQVRGGGTQRPNGRPGGGQGGPRGNNRGPGRNRPK